MIKIFNFNDERHTLERSFSIEFILNLLILYFCVLLAILEYKDNLIENSRILKTSKISLNYLKSFKLI